MADRDVPAQIVCMAFMHLGCEAYIDRGFLVVIRRATEGVRVARQHLHEGKKDTRRRAALRTICRHQLGFTPEEFYRAVDAVSKMRVRWRQGRMPKALSGPRACA